MPATKTAKVMKLADVADGQTVEIVDGPRHMPSGRIYRIWRRAYGEHRYAWERFTNHRVVLHPSLNVIPAEWAINSEGRWIR